MVLPFSLRHHSSRLALNTIREALATEGPVVLDCWIDQDLSVFPMVPAGASLNEVFDEEDMKNNEQSV